MEDKEDHSEFKEEIIIEEQVIRSKPKKLNSKIIGKKTVLRKGVLKSSPPLAPKKSNAEFLVESIIKTYWTSKWKEQINIMKFSKVGYNKKRADFRNLCMKLDHSIKYHHYLYLTKLFDNMEKLPMKPGVKHDDFYGKIKLISKSTNKSDDKPKKEKEKKLINNEDKADNNIIIDNVEIKMDIPIVKEVEFNPEENVEIEKEKDNNAIIEGKIEMENDSPPKIVKINKKEKKIIKRKKNNDNIINIEEDNDNEIKNSKNENIIENNNNGKHFIEILRDAIKRVSQKNYKEEMDEYKDNNNKGINIKDEEKIIDIQVLLNK